jgi:hypothetical protein
LVLFYHQINLAFFCKEAYKHQVTKKEPKSQKKIIFFFVNLAFTSCSPEGESPPIGVILALSNLFAAMLRYNIIDQIFVLLAKKSSNTKAPRNHKEHKGRSR